MKMLMYYAFNKFVNFKIYAFKNLLLQNISFDSKYILDQTTANNIRLWGPGCNQNNNCITKDDSFSNYCDDYEIYNSVILFYNNNISSTIPRLTIDTCKFINFLYDINSLIQLQNYGGVLDIKIQFF